MTCEPCAAAARVFSPPCQQPDDEADYVVHECRIHLPWCDHLGTHLPPTLPMPPIYMSRKARRAAEDAATKWQRSHPPAVLWSMRVPIPEET